jgi:hypothetical protein
MQTNPQLLDTTSADHPLGPFFADGSNDSYCFYVSADPQLPGRYTVAARGDSGRLHQTSSAVVIPFGQSEGHGGKIHDINSGLPMLPFP